MKYCILVIAALSIISCISAPRGQEGLVDFNSGSLHGTRIDRLPDVGEQRPEQEQRLMDSSVVVLDARLVSCFPLSGVNGASIYDGYAQAAFFFIVDDVRLGRWVGITLSIESSDRVSPSKGDMHGLGAGFYTLRDKYRFYLSSDTVQTSIVVSVRRLTDTTSTLPDRELPEGWEPVKDSTSDYEIPEGVGPVKGIQK